MIIRNINLTDSDYLKGIGILLIMLHNYFHILENAPGENEFSFSLQNTRHLLHNLYDTPWDISRQFFSYFGHYGLQLFIFLSGYGLAKKFAVNTIPPYLIFISSRFKKLYPVLFFAVVFLLFYKTAIELLLPHKDIDLTRFINEAALKLTLTANLIPGQGFTVSGPWWFFSLIFQLYLLAPALLRIRKINWLLAIMGVSWVAQLIILTAAPAYIEYSRLNFLGHLPEFCLGIYLARSGEIRLRKWWIALAAALFLASAVNPYLWVFSNVLATVLFIAAYSWVSPVKGDPVTKVITFFGRNSLYFFTVHGLCRAPFVPAGNSSVVGSVLAAVVYLLVVTVLTLLFKYIVQTITPFGRPSRGSLLW